MAEEGGGASAYDQEVQLERLFHGLSKGFQVGCPPPLGFFWIACTASRVPSAHRRARLPSAGSPTAAAAAAAACRLQKLDKLPEAKQQALLKELTADMQEAKT